MSIWLIRAGGSGEYEGKFLSENRVYVTWDGYSVDLSQFSSQEELRTSLAEYYPNEKLGTIKNWSSQIWPFAHRMEIGDWVVLPSKKKGSIHFGKLTGNYVFHPEGPDPYFHSRCRFRPKPATHSGSNLPLIPGETCHPFRRKVYHFSGHFRNAQNN